MGNYRFLESLINDPAFCLSVTEDVKFLDIGCGDGSNLAAMKKRFNNKGLYYGVDPSCILIEKAKEKYHDINFMNAYMSGLPFESDSIDCIISTFTFHHIPFPEMKAGIREIKRVLCPGGTFVYVDFGRPDTLYTKIVMTLFSQWFECIYSNMTVDMVSLMHCYGLKVKVVEKKTVVNGRVYCILSKKP